MKNLFNVRSIPIRYISLIIFIISISCYFFLGTSNKKLSIISGNAEDFKILFNKKNANLKINITLDNYRDTIFYQNYFIILPTNVYWGINGKSLEKLIVNRNSKIMIYYDEKDTESYLNSDVTMFKTYGLIVDGKIILNPNKRLYLTFGISILGLISLFSLVIFFFSYLIYILNKKRINVKKDRSLQDNKILMTRFQCLEKEFKDKPLRDLSEVNIDKYIEYIDLNWIINRDYKKCEENYIHILNIYPQNINALFMFSQMLINNQEYDRADVLLEKVYKLDSSYKKIFSDIFKNLEDKKRYQYWHRKSI